MATYKVGSDGTSQQLGLKAGDKVVTAGGTYTINADGSKSLDKSVTTSNYTGKYDDVDYTQNINYLLNNGGSTTDVAKQVGNLETKLNNNPNLTSTSNQTALSNAYAYLDSANKQGYDPTQDEYYQQAMAALKQAQANQPTYNSTYSNQLADLYNQITNSNFSYDINDDALYQQYAQMYTNNGRQAMEDTAGQAAALTGGYGSSYGSTASQQEYDRYMQELNDIIPTLYNQKYGEYQDNLSNLYNMYSLINDQAEDEYNQYLDNYNQWYNNLQFAANQAETAYNQGYQNWASGVDQSNADREYQLELDKWNYEKAQDTASNSSSGSGSGNGDKTQEQADDNVTFTTLRNDLIDLKEQGATRSEMFGVVQTALNKGYITKTQASNLYSEFGIR